MKQTSILLTAVLVINAAGTAAVSQTRVLDLDTLSGGLGRGLLTPDETEFVFQVDNGALPSTLFSATLAGGLVRPLPTAGVDVGFFEDATADRLLVFNNPLTGPGLFSIDLVGGTAPIPLLPTPGGFEADLAPAGDQVFILQQGNPFSPDPAGRDQLFTRSLGGGPATEVTGGVPSGRGILELDFAGDGQSLLYSTAALGEFSTDAFLATPGVAGGATEVLTNLAPEALLDLLGSDDAGDHFVVAVFGSGTANQNGVWSVPTANPAAAARITEDAQGAGITTFTERIDPPRGRLLFGSLQSTVGQPDRTAVLARPLDNSTPAQTLAVLPTDQMLELIEAPAGGPWVYTVTSAGGSEGDQLFAINSGSGDVAAFEDPGGNNLEVASLQLASSGAAALFTDIRDVGNDLYLAEPNATGGVQRTLLEVADQDRLVNFFFTDDNDFAIVLLSDAGNGTDAVGDRLLAVPLDGGDPIPLEGGEGAGSALIENSSFAPQQAGDTIFYRKLAGSDEVGFFTVDLPADSDGDYNNDRLVNAGDYPVWRDSVGAAAGTLLNDPTDEPIGQGQYETWIGAFETATAPDGDNGPDGDFNADNLVNAGDYTAWRDSVGAPSGALPNDPGDGPIGTEQYLAWREAFRPSGAAAVTVRSVGVPEPATLSIAGLTVLISSGSRRRSG